MDILIKGVIFLLFILLFSCERKSGRRNVDKSEVNSSICENLFCDFFKGLTADKNRNQKDNTESANLTIATWNIQDLGRTKDAEEILQIAKILRDFDVVAIQEVVAKDPAGAQAVAKIADVLNRMGNKWDYSISDPTKSPSVYISERYAFLWKSSNIQLVKKPFLDKELEDLCFREPYIAKFKLKKGGDSFYIINYHSRKHSDKPEEEIVHFKEIPKRLDSNRIFIVGDFNLNERHNVWDDLYYLGFKPSLKNTPTTLKTKCKNGNYFNYAIDNIIYNSSNIELINSGRIDFVQNCENLKTARSLSDHLPVFMEFKLNIK